MTLMPMPAGGDVPGIDADAERGRFMLMLAATAAFLVASWHTFHELRYFVSGQQAVATVQRVNRVVEPGRRSREYLRVEAEFEDRGGARRAAVLRAPLDSGISDGQRVDIEFLPSDPDRVRIKGDRNVAWMAVFAVSTAWMTRTLVRLVRESRRPIPSSRGRRSSR
ncbi:hypothetical protein Pan44_48210 [Caulifigura coniformis]|uniref:DUF3592 domain-containing protein n=1 Tax=Caulifigura coniformis TaxID=2527983 RepID=A0A517SKW4_9PLAN|nr:DUF3592 domain-containing protein [Caulifigura coniformis]QDT56761.1 hypothetical protein Pan44_48210 [Caulifigura coniformis]